MPITLSFDAIARQFDPRYFERGLDYFNHGRVDHVEVHRDGHVITGFSHGASRKRTPYRVHTVLHNDGADVQVEGNCTCPVAYNCKHVAAVLLQALAQQRAGGLSLAHRIQPPHVRYWLDDLQAAAHPKAIAPKPQTQERLLYVLKIVDGWRRPVPLLGLIRARQLKKGGYGKGQPYVSASLLNRQPPAFLSSDDLVILRALLTRQMFYGHSPERLEGDGSGDTLARILATGRCHWQSQSGPQLAAGEPRHGMFQWHTDTHGNQQLQMSTDCEGDQVIACTPPYYVDLSRGLCGPILVELPAPIVHTLLAAPPIAPGEVPLVAEQLAKLPVPVPKPAALRTETTTAQRPTPVIHLGLNRLSTPRGFEDITMPQLQLHFDYDGQLVPADDREPMLVRRNDNVVQRMMRHLHTELEAAGRLAEWGFRHVEHPYEDNQAGAFEISPVDHDDWIDAWIDFMVEALPQLRADGWRVEMDGNFPFRTAEPGDWHGRISESGDNGWFDLELGIDVDGERVSLLPILTRMIRQMPELLDPKILSDLPPDHRMIFPLDDGRLLPLPTERLRPILNTLIELCDPNASERGTIELPRWRAAEVAQMDGAQLNWEGGENVQALGRQLKDFDRIQPCRAPASFRGKLRGYQQQGLSWLQFLREYELGGVLADDMGLGKTVQVLSHLLTERDSGRMAGPVLVVAPTSVVGNWRREAEAFAPTLKVVLLHGPARKLHFDRLNDYDLILTTYALLHRDLKTLAQCTFHQVILDEAQYIKNPAAKSAQAARQLNTEHRLCLTGTPLENHLGELWSLFHFLMPGLLGSEQQFKRLFRTPIERHGDGQRAAQLQRRIAPFLLRRTKDQVATELPPRTDMVRTVTLEGAQRDLYESVRAITQKKVQKAIAEKGLERSRIDVLDALLKLRQICCDPRLLKLEQARKVTASAKLTELMTLLPELLEEGRRILLFSQFTSMLALIEEELKKASIAYAKLTGQTRNRDKVIQQFQNGDVPLFLISLKAGGTGLNLTAADTVIHYDPWWNPAVENQATDRAHRIGQTKPVFVYKLLTEGSVEERIQQLQQRKRQLADGLFSGNGGKLPGAEELQALFEPLG